MLLKSLKHFAETKPNELAFIGQDGNTSWKDLLHSVDQVFDELMKFKGKRVLVYIDGRLRDQLALMISTSQIPGEFIFISSFHNLERAKILLEEFDGEHVITRDESVLKIVASRASKVKQEITEPYLGVLTSGTTGKPKCARYSWDRLASAVALNPKFEGRRWMMSYHITNFAGLQVFLQCFSNGGCLVFPRAWPPDSKDDIGIIVSSKVHYLNCTATYSRKIAISLPAETRTSISCITLGGEIVDQQLINTLKKSFPAAKIIHIYASTEMGARIEVRDEREGFPLSLVDDEDIRILDGELQLRPSNRSMISYLGLTNPGVKSSVTEIREQGEWIATGDLVEVKGDRVLFMGRRDLLINVGGFKVNPAPVEAEIRKVESVHEVVVTGHKNPVSGNIVKATIVAKKGADLDATRAAILKCCKENLPYYSVPRVLEFIDSFALTSSSKIKRAA